MASPRTGSGAPSKETSPLQISSGTVAILALAILVGLLILPRWFGSQRKLVGHTAPDFDLEAAHNAVSGSRIKLSAFVGHPVLLDFWASWCGPCQQEAPIVERTYQSLRSQGLVVVGVDTNDEPGLSPAFAQKKGLTYPLVYDAGDRVAGLYGVSLLPTIVVIDVHGNVSAITSGVEGQDALEALVRGAM